MVLFMLILPDEAPGDFSWAGLLFVILMVPRLALESLGLIYFERNDWLCKVIVGIM